MARSEALGIIETFGIVYCIEAADAMCKAADVELIGFENTASGYISALVEGDVLARATKKHLVQEAVRLASGVGNTVARGDPRLLPRDDSFFHFSNNAISDFLVNIHALAPFLLWGARTCGRISLLP